MLYQPTIHSVTLPCPECGGDIPFEVTEQPPLIPGSKPRWSATDGTRACGCQVWQPMDGLTDEEAHERAWRDLDQRAIAVARGVAW